MSKMALDVLIEMRDELNTLKSRLSELVEEYTRKTPNTLNYADLLYDLTQLLEVKK